MMSNFNELVVNNTLHLQQYRECIYKYRHII